MATKRVVGFSGGVDSQACALWVRQRFAADEVILLNSDAGGNEHPLTDAFIRIYSADVCPVVMIAPLIRDLEGVGSKDGATGDRRREFAEDDKLTFDRLAYVKGRFPSKTAQFCTTFLKLVPQRRWCQENLTANGIEYERYTGVRRDESTDRRDTPDSWWDDFFDCEIHCPIAGWSKKQCFDFCQKHGEEVNPLYRMGFSRIGCAPCVNSNKDDIRNWAARFPEMIDKVREWEQRVGTTFFPPIMPGRGGPRRHGWVDEVVAWSRTVRGGRVMALPFVEAQAAAGSCSSKYGLCE